LLSAPSWNTACFTSNMTIHSETKNIGSSTNENKGDDTAIATNPTKRRLRIACCAMPMTGHLNPIMNLAEGLVTRNKTNTNERNITTGNVMRSTEVCLFTISYGISKVESRCQALGIRLVGIPLGEGFDSDEAIDASMKGAMPFPTLADRSKTLMEEALDGFTPDVVVSDFACLASQEYAAARNIPLVINWTGPFLMILKFSLHPVLHTGNDDWYFAAGGLLVSYTPLSLIRTLLYVNAADLGTFAARTRNCINCGNSLVMVNSFWGFEKPQLLLYPNIVPVGPIEKALPRSPDFSDSHPELDAFLREARGNHNNTHPKKVLLATMGTMVVMEAWLVRLLWEAFERLSSRGSSSGSGSNQSTVIVWSLKEELQVFLSKEQLSHPAFHIRKWLPQPALMASDLVDGVFTHCGWGGTLECITGGKPLVVLPFFGDQADNANLLVEAGCALTVTAIPPFNVDITGKSSYADPNVAKDLGFGPRGLFERFRRRKISGLKAENVTEGCVRLLGDPRYRIAAQRLQTLSSGPGMGLDLACERIEHAGKHGLRHLTESGKCNGNNSSSSVDTDGAQVATHANRVTGHRPLVMSLVMVALAGVVVKSAAEMYTARYGACSW